MSIPTKPVVIDGRDILRAIARYTRYDAKQFVGELQALVGQKIIPRDVLNLIDSLVKRRIPVTLANVAEIMREQKKDSETKNFDRKHAVKGSTSEKPSALPIILTSKRGKKVESEDEVSCSDCGKKRHVVWKYNSNRGIVQLCETCKTEASWRSFKMNQLKLKHRDRIKVVYPVGIWCTECNNEVKVLWRFESNKGTVELCGRCKESAFQRSFLGNRPSADAINFSVRGGSFDGD